MTRNNLGDQLSWLLRNIIISKPTELAFPPARDPAGADSSQSQLSRFGSSGSQQELPTRPVPRADLGRPNAGQPPHPLEEVDQEPRDTSLVTGPDAGSMAKLTSASKPRKPSLAVKHQQLLTPSSTTSGGRFQQAYTAKLQQEGMFEVYGWSHGC